MIEIYFDGACGPKNPGGTAAWGFLIKKNGTTVFKNSKVIGSGEGMTNNLAEYHALLAALKFLTTSNQPSIANHQLAIYTDSNLVYNMVAKKWGWNKKKTVWHPHKNHPHLKKLLFETLELLKNFEYEIKWIPREKNQEADTLSKKPLQEMGINV